MNQRYWSSRMQGLVPYTPGEMCIRDRPQGVDHSPGGQLGGGALRACADAHSLQVMDIKRAGANGGHPVGGAGKDSGNGPQVFISGGAVLRAVDSGIGGVARHQPQVDLAGGKEMCIRDRLCGVQRQPGRHGVR